jgi:hypothetical protein
MIEYIVECKEVIGITGKPIVVPCSIDLSTEIVRCSDCIYYKPDPDPIDPGWPMMCERTGDDMVEPYGFCAWGDRKDQ